MVDSTKGVGALQQIQHAERISRAGNALRDKNAAQTSGRMEAMDQVTISSDAQSLAAANDAQQTSLQIRLALQENPQLSLSPSSGRLDELL